ncbi:MAG: hypothetical protein J6A47_06600, partial [Bacilli bacterium]|nr:hypothetical protein [Bacilli bacterium]
LEKISFGPCRKRRIPSIPLRDHAFADALPTQRLFSLKWAKTKKKLLSVTKKGTENYRLAPMPMRR